MWGVGRAQLKDTIVCVRRAGCVVRTYEVYHMSEKSGGVMPTYEVHEYKSVSPQETLERRTNIVTTLLTINRELNKKSPPGNGDSKGGSVLHRGVNNSAFC